MDILGGFKQLVICKDKRDLKRVNTCPRFLMLMFTYIKTILKYEQTNAIMLYIKLRRELCEFL